MDTPLTKACANNDQQTVQTLIQNNVWDLNQPNHLGETPLMLACMNGYENIVHILINAKADLNIIDEEKTWTALMIASRLAKKNIVKMLIDAQADVNYQDQIWGLTAIVVAYINKDYDIIQMLIDAKADINVKTNANMCLLTMAAKDKDQKMISILLQNNVDTNLPGIQVKFVDTKKKESQQEIQNICFNNPNFIFAQYKP